MWTQFVLTESTISGPWRSNDPRPSPNFLHSCVIKSGSGLGTRLVQRLEFVTYSRYQNQFLALSISNSYLRLSWTGLFLCIWGRLLPRSHQSRRWSPEMTALEEERCSEYDDTKSGSHYQFYYICWYLWLWPKRGSLYTQTQVISAFHVQEIAWTLG